MMKKQLLQQVLAGLLMLALVMMPQTAALGASPELAPGQSVNCTLTAECNLLAGHEGPCKTLEEPPAAEMKPPGVSLMAASNAVTQGGLTVTGPDVQYGDGDGFTLNASGDYVISGTWNGSLSRDNDVITVPTGVNANVTLDNVIIDVSGTDYACAFAVQGSANIALTGTNTLNLSLIHI